MVTTSGNVSISGYEKVLFFRSNIIAYFVSSVMAGLLISFGSFVALASCGLCSGALGAASKLVMAFSYASALSFVIFAGGELFTGNNLVVGASWYSRCVTPLDCISLWSCCWIGNLVGSWIGVLLFHLSGADGIKAVADTAAAVASAKCSYSATEMIFRGVLCNALVCLAVRCGFRMKDETAKLVMIFWCIFAFMVCGFEHSVANMSIIGVALVGGSPADIGFLDYAVSLLFVTIGNVIGGLCLVAIPYCVIDAFQEYSRARK